MPRMTWQYPENDKVGMMSCELTQTAIHTYTNISSSVGRLFPTLLADLSYGSNRKKLETNK